MLGWKHHLVEPCQSSADSEEKQVVYISLTQVLLVQHGIENAVLKRDINN